MRTVLWVLNIVVLLVLVAHFVLPGIVERKFNLVTTPGPYVLAEADQALYERLDFVADLHSDALLWGRDLARRSARGHVDVPRLIEGGVALQAFTIVSKTPKGQNYGANTDQTDNITALMIAQGRHPRTWNSLLARGLEMSARLHETAADHRGFRIVKSAADLRAYVLDRERNRSQTAGLLGAEGLHLLEGDSANIDRLYEAGFRMVAPVHFFDNETGGSAHGVSKGGLTPFGKTVLAKAERRGMLIDLSHGSDQLISDILDVATRPLIVSHTGVRALCPGGRNLSDAQLRRIGHGGGLVGIALFEGAVCTTDLSGTARAMRHAVDVMGLAHVALGSDFDGAVTTPVDVTGVKMLVPELRAVGFGESEIAALMGGNVRDFLLANLPAE